MARAIACNDCYQNVTECSITSGHGILHKMYIHMHKQIRTNSQNILKGM